MRRLNRSASNCRPWSVVILAGVPYRVIHSLYRHLAIVSAVMSGTGMASGHLVNQSMMVRQYLYSFDGGSGPTMWMCSNRLVGLSKFPIGVTLCLVTLAL